MGRNLPDRVSISDTDAPWNQPDPEPYCPKCGEVVINSDVVDESGVWYCEDCDESYNEEQIEVRYYQ